MSYRTSNTPSPEEIAAYYKMKNARAKTARQYNIEASNQPKSIDSVVDQQAILNAMSKGQ